MKRKITQFLMLAIALVWAIPQVSAVEYKFSTPTKVWSQTETTYSGIYRNIAVSGDDIFTLPAPPNSETTDCTDGMYGSYTCGLRFSSSKVVAFSGGSTASAFPYGSGSYYFMGPAMASDSKGTIVAATIKGSITGVSWSNKVAAICYYLSNPSSDDLKHTNPSAGTKSGFSISTDALRISGRTDRMTAYGDISKTGYLWFVPGTSANTTEFYGLERITVTSYGSPVKTQFSFPAEITKASGNTDRVLQYTDNNLLLDVSGQNYYKGTISGTNTVTWKNLNIKVVSGGASMFVLQGHEILAYSSDATTITLVDITQNNKVIGTFSPFATQSANSATRHAIDVRVSGNTANIYVLVPGQGAAKYTITATEIPEYTDPVSSLGATINVDANGDQYAVLTWTAPSANATHVKNYKVYRGNTEIATVANNVLTYTDTEALTAETTYKVIPVYDNDVTVGTDVTVTIAPMILTAPVKNLTASCKYAPVGDGTYIQQAVLLWEVPASGASNVESYTIYRGDTQLATVGSEILTYTDTEALTAETTYKVVPNYEGGSVGDEATVTIAPTVYTAPTNLAVSQHAGYARVTITYTKCKDVAGLYVKYDILRDGAVIAHDLTQAEYVDTYVPAGEHSYTVEAEYYMPDAQGNYTVEVARVRCATTETINVAEMNHTLVNYTLVEEYNYEVWDIWNWDQANGKKLPANFNPNIKDGSSWIDAEHYRQGALVTDANGKKWWYIMQKTNSTTINEEDGNSGGVLKISADGADLQAGGNAEMLSLPLAVKNGQSSGIAADEYGNFLIRGWYQAYDDAGAGAFNDAHNFATDLDNVIIYSADLSKSFVVDLSGLDFNTDPEGLNTNQWNSERVDYYRVSGDLMGTSYLYVVAGYGGSRTYTKVEMVNNGTEVEAHIAEQYTPTTLDNGTAIKIASGDGAENYAFPIEETLAGSKGVIYQKRSIGYLYVPEGGGSNKNIFTSTGKIANTGGTTAKMANAKEASAAQLFLITPQSFHSRNIGSFSVAIVPNNNFANAVIPIANKVQVSSENINADAEADNANANWLFAEWDAGDPEITGDENLYIYQYVPGVRIAKYRMYGSIGFYDTTPTLTINTTYDEDEGDITHFTATATWATPESYNGAGDYAIKYYKVELLDKNNNVIDEREVPATEGLYEFNRQDYTVTFNTTADLSNGSGVATGNEENYFIDDESLYTVRVTTVYDLRQVMQGTTFASSDLRNSATNTDQAQHIYNTQEPVPSVNIYKGTSGAVTGIYRIEFDLATPASTDERVSHYELYYTRKKLDWNTPDASTESGFAESLVTERIEDFILVSGSSLLQDITATEGQDVIPGVLVRNELHGQYMADSKDDCYAAFFYDSKQDEWTEYNNDPTSWTYTIKAVYADDNTLLRKTTSAEVIPAPGVFIPTGVDDISNNVTELNAYPIPADTELTIQSGQNIEMVTILSTTGAEVKRVLGNGELRMTIDVEDLASGYYFLKVNNLPMVKIIVK